MSTSARADKVRQLRANPQCSAVHMDGDRIAVVASGTVEWIARDHPDHELIHRTWTEIYESDPYTWGDVVLFRLKPTLMWAYAFQPEEFRGHSQCATASPVCLRKFWLGCCVRHMRREREDRHSRRAPNEDIWALT
jgi:hypothetical protein